MGMSAITFYGGVDGALAFRDRISVVSGLPTSTGALSTAAALRTFGARSLSFLSPYFPNANSEVRRFFEESGFSVKRDHCLQCPNPRAIAQVPESALRPILLELDGDDIDAIVQVGTNLSMVGLAAAAERVLGKPVIAINAATYWHALREAGISDAVQGQGRLLSEH
jgi:maleate isomerase